VDEATEARLYRLVRDRLPGTTLFSVGHRATLRPFHVRKLVVQPDGDGPASIVEMPALDHAMIASLEDCRFTEPGSEGETTLRDSLCHLKAPHCSASSGRNCICLFPWLTRERKI
jgi:hypothetical protein